jgi:hypothetical protein
VPRKRDYKWVKVCTKMEVKGKTRRGRGSKTWIKGVKDDLRRLGLDEKDAEGR